MEQGKSKSAAAVARLNLTPRCSLAWVAVGQTQTRQLCTQAHYSPLDIMALFYSPSEDDGCVESTTIGQSWPNDFQVIH